MVPKHHKHVQAEKKTLKSCPLCRQPLRQVMRYGRILNKMKLDQADIQFAGQCHIKAKPIPFSRKQLQLDRVLTSQVPACCCVHNCHMSLK